VKRGQPLRRTSGLKRAGGLKAKPLDAAEAQRRAKVRGAVFARDGFACVLADPPEALAELGACWGRLEPHHVLKAGQGGPYTEDNLVTLCHGHNAAVEDHPAAAYLLGLVQRSTPLRDTPPPAS